MSNDVAVHGVAMQGAYPIIPDGQEGNFRLNRRGEQIVTDWLSQAGVEGRVFEVSNAAKQTALAAGGTTYSDTAPAFNIDVPAGTVIIPTEINLQQGGTVAGAVIAYLITTDNKVRWASSGTALTILGNRTDKPVGSQCSAYQGATLSAKAQDRLLQGGFVKQAVDGSGGQVLWTTRQSTPPVLVGPASLIIYTFAGTTQPSWFFRIAWVEYSYGQAI